ncbi:hypothetical protein [Billgrantia montanilacus]|uniref:Transmembrane sensor/regulator PpyR n=1 Tax=Billgrantia montanilacus TaxID=2282305 RepID=A0A368TYJ8_9GAMM|nr:hypothetical protein [Halomonas montanilacus]RCV88942.1 hypothetical protein DU505_12635 [Halomonas montanilacus]
MISVFQDANQTHSLGNALMAAGLLLLIMGILGGYILDNYLSLFIQVVAHLLVIAGPTLIKIGYVIRLNARQRLHLAY